MPRVFHPNELPRPIPPFDEAIDRLTTFLESHETSKEDVIFNGSIRQVPASDQLMLHGDRYGKVTAEARATDVIAVLAEVARLTDLTARMAEENTRLVARVNEAQARIDAAVRALTTDGGAL